MAISFSFDPAVGKKIKELGKDSIKRVDKLRIEFVKDVFKNAVKFTVVDTGNARSNWRIGIGRPIQRYTNVKAERPGKSGANAIAREQLLKVKPTTSPLTTWITNNTPYIDKLDARDRILRRAQQAATNRANRKAKL